MKRAVFVAVLAAYAWMTSGQTPFNAISYFVIGIPCVVFVVVYWRMGGLSTARDGSHSRSRSGNATLSTVAPWVGLITAVVILEAVGLLLGGRSASVPTLSTTVDHLLAVRWERCVLCFIWLLVGVFPLHQLRQIRRLRDS